MNSHTMHMIRFREVVCANVDIYIFITLILDRIITGPACVETFASFIFVTVALGILHYNLQQTNAKLVIISTTKADEC